MKTRHLAFLLLVHAILLLAASTQWTAFSWSWGNRAWTWNYFMIHRASGWGYVYKSDYSLAVVWTYLLAYGAGLVAYSMASARTHVWWPFLGGALCVLGLVSFTIEISHWLFGHHLSLIVTCSAASLILAAIGGIQLLRAQRQETGGAGGPDQNGGAR